MYTTCAYCINVHVCRTYTSISIRCMHVYPVICTTIWSNSTCTCIITLSCGAVWLCTILLYNVVWPLQSKKVIFYKTYHLKFCMVCNVINFNIIIVNNNYVHVPCTNACVCMCACVCVCVCACVSVCVCVCGYIVTQFRINFWQSFNILGNDHTY